MHYLYSKTLGNNCKKNYNSWDDSVSEKGFSFGGDARNCITCDPMLEVNYILTNFGVFSDIQGNSFSLQF